MTKSNSLTCDHCCGTRGGVSAFDKGIIHSWYDGIVHGFAQCKWCDTTFACAMVAASDDLKDRCYLCAHIPTEDYVKMEDFIRNHTVRDSNWIHIDHVTSELDGFRYDEHVQRALSNRTAPGFVVVAKDISANWAYAAGAHSSLIDFCVFEDIATICGQLEARRKQWYPLAGAY